MEAMDYYRQVGCVMVRSINGISDCGCRMRHFSRVSTSGFPRSGTSDSRILEGWISSSDLMRLHRNGLLIELEIPIRSENLPAVAGCGCTDQEVGGRAGDSARTALVVHSR